MRATTAAQRSTKDGSGYAGLRRTAGADGAQHWCAPVHQHGEALAAAAGTSLCGEPEQPQARGTVTTHDCAPCTQLAAVWRQAVALTTERHAETDAELRTQVAALKAAAARRTMAAHTGYQVPAAPTVRCSWIKAVNPEDPEESEWLFVPGCSTRVNDPDAPCHCDDHTDNECIRQAWSQAEHWHRKYVSARRQLALRVGRTVLRFRRCSEHPGELVDGCPACERRRVAQAVDAAIDLQVDSYWD